MTSSVTLQMERIAANESQRTCYHTGNKCFAFLPSHYGVPFSHLFTELQISPIEVHISPIQLQISTIHLQISTIQLGISPNRLNCRYLRLNWKYLQINCRYLQILSIWRYLQMNCRYLQFDKSDKISAPRRKNRCAMIQVSGLIKSCI